MDPTPDVVWQPRPKFQDRVWLHVLLFALTIASTTVMGAFFYVGFLDQFRGSRILPMPIPRLLVRGLWYSGTILGILGCHELGHYFACRYYDVDASLPFFIPLPPPFITGTLGAVIRIREQIPQKKMLFDIGIAGPIAGFVVAVPSLFIGMALSNVVRLPASFTAGDQIGEPLLFKFAAWVFWGRVQEGYALNLHPMAFAAWFGMLATIMNLFPAIQLDGGHISYAVFGRRIATYITFAAIAFGLYLAIFQTWIVWGVWTGMIVVMAVITGPRHPPVFDEDSPLSHTRLLFAALAVVIFILCFTPVPITLGDLIGH